MFDPPINISYRTSVEVPRPGRIGALLRWLGDHPAHGGFVCGLAVVLIAAVYSFDGVAAQPEIAAILSLIVVFAWTVLFWLMRGFFEAQSFVRQAVLRRILVDDEQAVWYENDEPQRQFDNPRLQVLTNPVPEALDDGDTSGGDPTAWPVWIVIDTEDTDDAPLVFETRDAAARARDYGEVPDTIIENTDERLPRAIASPMLQRAAEYRGALQ